MLLLDSLQQFDVALPDFLAILATVGLLLVFLLTALTAPLVAFLTESIYAARRKAFYDKCALQITQVAFGLGMLMFLLLGGGSMLVIMRHLPEMLSPPLVWHLAAALGAPLAGLILLLIYLASWNILKKARSIHLTFGFLATTVLLAVLIFGFVVMAALQQPFLAMVVWNAPLAAVRVLFYDFIKSPVLWVILGYLFTLGFAATGALAQLWLIVRRTRADYGRDYYAFAMRYCARAAFFFTLLMTGLAAGAVWLMLRLTPPPLSQTQEPGLLAVAGGLPLCCCLLWLCVIKSATPLRHKPGAFFACLFLFASVCAQILLFVNAFPMK